MVSIKIEFILQNKTMQNNESEVKNNIYWVTSGLNIKRPVKLNIAAVMGRPEDFMTWFDKFACKTTCTECGGLHNPLVCEKSTCNRCGMPGHWDLVCTNNL